MLFKNLKEIICEVDETDSTVDSNETNTDNKSDNTSPRKPKQTIKHVADASDGVGNEAYDISNEIAKTLETDLTEYYNIYKVEASNNKITITAKLNKMKDGLLTSKMTGNAIPNETLLNTIQQIIIADLGKEIDKFKLDGPFSVAPGVLVITVVPM